MVLSNRLTAPPRAGLGKRTAIYVAAFGVGSLLIATLLSIILVSVAEGLLPSDAAPADSDTPAADDTGVPRLDLPRKDTSPRRPRISPSLKNRPPRPEGRDEPTIKRLDPTEPSSAEQPI